WGGLDLSCSCYLNTGGRYNPSTDSWTATSTTNAPVAREFHTAVWTESEMIIWGGLDLEQELITGGRYNPDTDSWTPTSTTNTAHARASPRTVVRTCRGSAEIVGGGGEDDAFDLNTGGNYNPGTDSWTATSTTNAPEARFGHTAVWTGSEMIVWGGYNDSNVF